MGRSSNRLDGGTRWVASQDGAGTCSLDTAESLQFLRLDGNLSAKANLAGSPLDEGHAVGVQRLVNRGSTRGGLDQGDTSGSESGLVGGTTIATFAEVLDHSGIHSELDEIEG